MVSLGVDPDTYSFEDDGAIPNSGLPALIYHELESAKDAGSCEELFAGPLTRLWVAY